MSKLIKPITPEEAEAKKNHDIPAEVIKVFNNLISKNLVGGVSKFKQDDVVKEIIATTEFTKEEIFEEHYLDVEPLFREVGWKVDYDKPGYNETYPSTFTFTGKAYVNKCWA